MTCYMFPIKACIIPQAPTRFVYLNDRTLISCSSICTDRIRFGVSVYLGLGYAFPARFATSATLAASAAAAATATATATAIAIVIAIATAIATAAATATANRYRYRYT